MTAAALGGFFRRELAPTPGRGAAAFRLTLACVIATIPILTHRILAMGPKTANAATDRRASRVSSTVRSSAG